MDVNVQIERQKVNKALEDVLARIIAGVSMEELAKQVVDSFNDVKKESA